MAKPKRDPVVREAQYRERVHREPPLVHRHAKKGDPQYTTPRQVTRTTVYHGRKAGQAGRRITQRRYHGPSHVLTAELITGLLIVLVRVVADYEPQADGTVKGKVGHPKGEYGPLPIAAGLIGTFFVLSFLVAKGGRWAAIGNASGALVVLSLGLKSVDEFDKVAKTFGNWGKGKKPAGAWESTGVPAGALITSSGQGSSSSGSSGSSDGPNSAAYRKWKTTHPHGNYIEYMKTHPGAGIIIGPVKAA